MKLSGFSIFPNIILARISKSDILIVEKYYAFAS